MERRDHPRSTQTLKDEADKLSRMFLGTCWQRFAWDAILVLITALFLRSCCNCKGGVAAQPQATINNQPVD